MFEFLFIWNSKMMSPVFSLKYVYQKNVRLINVTVTFGEE